MSNLDRMLKNSWEKYKLKKAERYKHGESYERLKREESLKFIVTHFKSVISIPIIIGVIASIIMYQEFGWKKLEEVLLSWTIGLTIIATIITLLERYTKIITK